MTCDNCLHGKKIIEKGKWLIDCYYWDRYKKETDTCDQHVEQGDEE